MLRYNHRQGVCYLKTKTDYQKSLYRAYQWHTPRTSVYFQSSVIALFLLDNDDIVPREYYPKKLAGNTGVRFLAPTWDHQSHVKYRSSVMDTESMVLVDPMSALNVINLSDVPSYSINKYYSHNLNQYVTTISRLESALMTLSVLEMALPPPNCRV